MSIFRMLYDYTRKLSFFCGCMKIRSYTLFVGSSVWCIYTIEDGSVTFLPDCSSVYAGSIALQQFFIPQSFFDYITIHVRYVQEYALDVTDQVWQMQWILLLTELNKKRLLMSIDSFAPVSFCVQDELSSHQQMLDVVEEVKKAYRK